MMTAIASLSRRDARVTIGPVLPDDMGALYLWFNDVEAAKLDFPYVPVDGIAFKAWVEKQARSEGEYLFAIRRLQELPLIGYGLIRNVHPIHRSAEIGIRIGRETDRGKGYGASALRLMTDYVFDTLNLNRLSLSVRADNLRAIAAYEQAGFVTEGTLRQANYLNGAWVDMTIMAILKSEWRPNNVQSAKVPGAH
jgi:RimJ/RimL family protein N-acetyltransferase